MRDGWRETTLGAITTKIVKSAPTQDFDYVDISSVSRDAKAITAPARTKAGDAPGRARQHLRTDDVLVSTVRPNLNAVARVPEELDGAVGSTGFAVLRASDEVHPGILFAVARSSKFVETMTERSTGSNYPAVTDKIVREFPVVLPPLDEQRRIVDLIAAVDDAVEAAEAEAVATSKTLAAERARVFGDPAETLLAGEAFDVAIGKQKSADKVDGSNVIPYLRSANVELGRIQVDDVLAMHFSERETERLTLRDRDVLITEGSASEVAVGVPAVWRGELEGAVGIQNALIRVRAVPEVSTPEFAEHWAFWAYESGTFREIANGTNIKHVGVERAKLVRVPRVDVAEQPALIAHMSALRDAADAARATAESLRALRSNLLTVLLSGEHEIPASYDALLGEVA